jgi:hypothetical protein
MAGPPLVPSHCRRRRGRMLLRYPLVSEGEYRESLQDGGSLVVSASGWHVEYYWSGPDQRYKGTFHQIPGANLERIVAALRENWSAYQELKATVPTDGEFTRDGAEGMTINVGGHFEGVCLYGPYGCIRTLDALNDRVLVYERARQRASEVRRALFAVDASGGPSEHWP